MKKFLFLFICIIAINTCALKCMNPEKETFKKDVLKKENAFECLQKAQNLMNTKYDFQSANKWFLIANDLYAMYNEKEITEEIKLQKAQTLIQLAMSYCSRETSDLRLKYLQEAKKLLGLPDNITDYNDETKFNEAAITYFIVYGYYFYIAYERSEKSGDKIEQQEEHLKMARLSFLKSIEITEKLSLKSKISENTMKMSTGAMQGLGTSLEFLGKCAKTRHNFEQAYDYFVLSNKTFEQVLGMREKLLGENDINVARSLHKLARSNVILSNFLLDCDSKEKNKLLSMADTNYQRAIKIFDKNKISPENAGRKELETEYTEFKKLLNVK